MVVFATLFATNFIEVQQCKKKNKFLLDLSQIDEIFSKFTIIRSHANFIPHDYFNQRLLIFFKHCILNQLIIL